MLKGDIEIEMERNRIVRWSTKTKKKATMKGGKE